MDQSARDFEAMRAESERVKEGKQALQEAIDISERELDEKLRARDRQISRLEAQLEKGASRAQRDQEHADELCRAHEKALQARDDEHRSAVAGPRSGSRTSYEKPTRRTLLNLRRLYKERGRRPKHLEGATRPTTRGRYAAAEASHNDAMREATLAERVANRAARDASEKRLRQTIDTAVRRAGRRRRGARRRPVRGGARRRRGDAQSFSCFGGRLREKIVGQ